ncbi:MAG: M56 family metallopeptidase, partial [Acetatifactor sp.]|nr:M56 family metallopeptidase [Acetatifactor sp.]
ILYILWQSGMILVLGFHMICYVCYVRKLSRHNKSADRKERELLNGLLERKSTLRFYKNPIVGKPILIGFFRPAVILPDKEYEDMQLRNILMHEITHWKKHDIFVKWLLILDGAIRWFDPLFYLVRREMNKACELACDESVIKRFDVNEMQQYGDTLIAVAADSVRKTPLSLAMFEDKKNLKERLGAIMKHRKYSKRTVLAACIILVTFVCVVLGISTFHHMGNEYRYSSAESWAQVPKVVNYMKEIETVKVIRNYDKENIAAAYVYLKDLDGMLSDAYIFLMCYEKRPDSEWESGVKSLVSEELELDIQKIHVEYADF